ncbi:hypothetical protein H4R33_005837 [Dimargaris cristalligena]|nr:hypothetical protein H4R33_005837 [Dimargaris cristalligena]
MKITFAASASLLLALTAISNAELSADKMSCIREAQCLSDPQVCLAECFNMSSEKYAETETCFNGCLNAAGDADQACVTKCQAEATQILGASLDDIQQALNDIYDEEQGQSSSTSASATTTSSAVSSAVSSASSSARASSSTTTSTRPSSNSSSDDFDDDESSGTTTFGVLSGSMTLAALAVARFHL